MTNELKAKRDELADKKASTYQRMESVSFSKYRNFYAGYLEGFDACHEIMQAKLDVAELKVHFYESDEKTKYVVRLYSELCDNDKKKIDDLMNCLLNIQRKE